MGFWFSCQAFQGFEFFRTTPLSGLGVLRNQSIVSKVWILRTSRVVSAIQRQLVTPRRPSTNRGFQLVSRRVFSANGMPQRNLRARHEEDTNESLRAVFAKLSRWL